MVLARALVEDRVLVSADTDFGTILASQGGSRPPFILFRESGLARPEDYAVRLLACLPQLEPELLRGSVAVFRAGRIRVRSLPFADS